MNAKYDRYIRVDTLTIAVHIRGISGKRMRPIDKWLGPLLTQQQSAQYHLFFRAEKTDAARPLGMSEQGHTLNICMPSVFYGKIHPQKKHGRFVISSDIRGFRAIFSIVYFLFICENGGFMIHGSSFAYNGGGYIFIGRQGVGKSTIARLSGQTVLSDDVAILVPRLNTYTVVSNPFDAKLKPQKTISVPLRGIYLLRHGKRGRNEIARMKTQEVRPTLLRHLRPNLKYFERAPSYLLLLTIAVKLFTSQFDGYYKMQFSKSKKFLQLL